MEPHLCHCQDLPVSICILLPVPSAPPFSYHSLHFTRENFTPHGPLPVSLGAQTPGTFHPYPIILFRPRTRDVATEAALRPIKHAINAICLMSSHRYAALPMYMYQCTNVPMYQASFRHSFHAMQCSRRNVKNIEREKRSRVFLESQYIEPPGPEAP